MPLHHDELQFQLALLAHPGRTEAAGKSLMLPPPVPEEVAEYRIAHLLVGDLGVVRLLAGELHRLLQLLHALQQLVDPRGRAGRRRTSPCVQ